MAQQARGIWRSLWLVPLLLLAAGTAAAWIFDLDRGISRLLFVPGAAEPWPVGNTDLGKWLESWVSVPITLLTVVALLLVGAALIPWGRPWRRPLLRAGLTFVVSVALWVMLLEGALRPLFGRPRPQEIIEFGGKYRFQPVLRATPEQGGGSFPSGHTAAAVALVLPFFVLRRDHPRWARIALLAGLAYGCLMAYLRIAHGRHFFSDVLWSFALVWFSGCAASALFLRVFPPPGPVKARAEADLGVPRA